jgi:hypothetical protein
VHALLPLLPLLAIRRLDARKVWVLWPLTFAPDLDYFVHLHRAALTNVFVLLPFAAVLAWALRKGDAPLVEWMGIALVYLAAHYVMDTFTGGIVPFFPLSDYTICYYADVDVNTTTNALTFPHGPCSHAGIPQVAPVYPFLSDTDAAMLALIVPFGLVMGAVSLRRLARERARRPPASEGAEDS